MSLLFLEENISWFERGLKTKKFHLIGDDD